MEKAYEVTLNNVSFTDEISGLALSAYTYAIANVRIKKITDEAIDGTENLHPFFGPIDEREAYINDVLLEYPDRIEDNPATILEGELAPGEKLTGDLIFSTHKRHL